MRQVHNASTLHPNTPKSDSQSFVLHKVDVTFAKGDKATVLIHAHDPLHAMDQIQLLSEGAVRGLVRWDGQTFYWAA